MWSEQDQGSRRAAASAAANAKNVWSHASVSKFLLYHWFQNVSTHLESKKICCMVWWIKVCHGWNADCTRTGARSCVHCASPLTGGGWALTELFLEIRNLAKLEGGCSFKQERFLCIFTIGIFGMRVTALIEVSEYYTAQTPGTNEKEDSLDSFHNLILHFLEVLISSLAVAHQMQCRSPGKFKCESAGSRKLIHTLYGTSCRTGRTKCNSWKKT